MRQAPEPCRGHSVSRPVVSRRATARAVVRLAVLLAAVVPPSGLAAIAAADDRPLEGPAVARVVEVDASMEARVKALALELRCLVCQNQTIADSHAELALDLRARIREQVAAGASDDAVRRYMVDRYGEFVLYRPPLHASTALLWFGPALLVVAGLAALALTLRRRARSAPQADPDDSLADEDSPVHLAAHRSERT